MAASSTDPKAPQAPSGPTPPTYPTHNPASPQNQPPPSTSMPSQPPPEPQKKSSFAPPPKGTETTSDNTPQETKIGNKPVNAPDPPDYGAPFGEPQPGHPDPYGHGTDPNEEENEGWKMRQERAKARSDAGEKPGDEAPFSGSTSSSTPPHARTGSTQHVQQRADEEHRAQEAPSGGTRK